MHWVKKKVDMRQMSEFVHWGLFIGVCSLGFVRWGLFIGDTVLQEEATLQDNGRVYYGGVSSHERRSFQIGSTRSSDCGSAGLEPDATSVRMWTGFLASHGGSRIWHCLGTSIYCRQP